MSEAKQEHEVKQDPKDLKQEEDSPSAATPKPKLQRSSSGSSSQLGGRTPSLVSFFKSQGGSVELDPASGFKHKQVREEPQPTLECQPPQSSALRPSATSELRSTAKEAAKDAAARRQKVEASAAEGVVIPPED